MGLTRFRNPVPTIVWRVVRRSLAMASVRYRALLPALSVEPYGYRSLIADAVSGIPLERADLLVVSKSFSVHDIALVRQARDRGIPVLLELCDNVFIPGYAAHHDPRPADVFREMARFADAVSCTTAPLARAIVAEIPSKVPVEVIPDSIEDDALLERERRLLDGEAARLPFWRRMADRFRRPTEAGPAPADTPALARDGRACVLWFGNHGSPHGDFGLADVVRFGDALAELARARAARLLVVSNHRERYESLVAPLAIDSDYLEWSPATLRRALAVADVVIVPNSLDEFSVCKSANRTVLALSSGVPVVATPTDSLSVLSPAIWTGDPLEGLVRYLDDPAAGRADVAEGRVLIEAHFSLEAVGRQWAALFARVLG